jgi:hypothetical protein
MRNCRFESIRLSAAIWLLGVAVLASGCSSFNSEWKRAARKPTTDALTGRWEGTWLSGVNAHSGKLRCVIGEPEDGVYRARFDAKYEKVLSFGYTVPLKVEKTDSGVSFKGEADLGWLAGGVYRYAGHADATNFLSTYSCKYDHGDFTMRRVPQEDQH